MSGYNTRIACLNTMDATKQEKLISRSKSTGCLDTLDNDYDFKRFAARFCGQSECGDHRHASVSSVDLCFACDGSDSSAEEANVDSGIKSSVDDEALFVLEQKVDKLHELLQEQHNLLMTIKENVMFSKAGRECQITKSSKIVAKSGLGDEQEINISNETKEHDMIEGSAETSSAQSLLDAITVSEKQPGAVLDDMIRVALENFLQSEDVSARLAAAVAREARGVARGVLWRALSAEYVPLVRRSHCRLVQLATRLLQRAFADLEESTGSIYRTVHKSSRIMRASLERHQHILENTRSIFDPLSNIQTLRSELKEVLSEELKPWRKKVLQELSVQILFNGGCESDAQESHFEEFSPPSPMQPANPHTSPIDALMECAIISKLVGSGDVEGAFSRALRSGELALVTAACRAAPPGPLPAPLRLALLRQLAADMVHDTQLKCRYLEESIIALDNCDAATREQLPLVVGEVRAHLTKFLVAYPKHHASRRVALIIMAADNLLK